MKRLFDLFVAVGILLPALLLTLPLLVIVYFQSGANPIFRQRRIGRDNREFTMFKLRTMGANTPDVASHHASAQQILPAGHMIRKFKLDELPQVVNVLRGEMSFVGPRPCLPSQIELIAERTKLGVHRLVPGITGLAQNRGIDMSYPPKLAIADAAYLGTWSVRRDLAIMIASAIGSGRGDAVGGGQGAGGERP